MAAAEPGIFSDKLNEKILASKILVVGAGGIGCEILKNLVLSGFNDIEIIDLDTIDVSNLNRQFLFHKEHVGKSKAEIARQSALDFNPKVNIKAYHDSITSTDYGVNFFQKFSLILNALDNRQARNHVNRMCLNADVPLIESGTAGYNGQVELIKKGLTQCYECQPKAAQKSYPGCTIRNTPSEPIHCIVWAKHLFNQLFGETNEDEEVSPDTADPEAGGNAGSDALAVDSNERGNIDRINTRQWAQSTDYDPEKIYNKLFHDDIKYLLSMSNLWKNRTPPQPIKWSEISLMEMNNLEINSTALLPDQKIWSLTECGKNFSESITALKTEFKKLSADDHLVWDKDDKHGMDFVASCANIRARIFNISQKSRFDIKSMAGNIIPAIATTNAITAGVVVMHAFKILLSEFEKCKSVYMRLRPNPRNQLFVPDKFLNPPNPKCYVCSAKPTVYLKVDTEKLTVKELRDDVLIKSLNMVEPDVTLDVKGVIVISSEEGETDCNNDKKLKELGICDGVVLKVDDFFQKYELSIIVTHADAEYDKPLFEVIADPEHLKPKSEENTDSDGKENQENGEQMNDEDSDDCKIVEKRPRIELSSDLEMIPSSSGAGNKPLNLANKDLVNLDSSSDDDCIEVSSSVHGIKRKPTSEGSTFQNNGEGPSNTKRLRIQPTDDKKDDLIIIDDD